MFKNQKKACANGARYVCNTVSKAKFVVALLAMGILGTISQTVQAAVDVSTTTGISLDTEITSAITALGAIVLAALGGYIAYKVVRLGMRWIGRIGG